jgi:nifR3 family TIM-barrel protein
MKRFPKLENQAVLSPMAGVTDVAFRTLCKKYGAALTYTEFLSSQGILRAPDRFASMLRTDPSEKPVAVQLFGNSVHEVVQAAQAVEDRFDIIDINCGCPAWKVIKSGAGSKLLEKPDGIATFVGKLASAVNKPVTIKILSGIDENHINAVEVAKKAEDAGASAVAIHGRTASQGYRGHADWNIIKRVKEAVGIPVIGNGDVFSPETFEQRLTESGVDAIMIARGAIGNPFIFSQIESLQEKKAYAEPDKIKDFHRYFSLAKKYDIPFPTIKTHAMSFTKGIPHSAKLRESLGMTKTSEEILFKLERFSESE